MNIEELSKSQLILLTILVNFVTSVATGILTVSLLDHAPPVVTQTVNRIVEHTIETVAQAAPAVIIKAPTPAPSTEELVTGAIAASASRLAWVYDASTGTTSPALAIGTYLPKSRAVVTTANAQLPKEVLVRFPDESTARASLAHSGEGLIIYGFSDTEKLPTAAAPLLLSDKELKLGQTVLAISNDGGAATAIISRVADDGVHTTLPEVGSGAAAVDLSGNLIGIAVGGTPGLLVSAEHVRNLLTATSTAASSAQ
ncbi:MAG TPA: hypothetical protein VM103_01085 [Candidatus Paceibacterota bacterium]|nr:hypothetical protein [Candidatus Paceibacterota bacterium]